MQFKYSFEDRKGDKIPFVNVVITNKDNDNSVSYKAMLDSGAYANVFHSDVAEILGIDLDAIKERHLFGGVKDSKKQMIGKGYVVEIMVVEKGKNYRFDSYVIFSSEVSNNGFALLGRQGFFDRFEQICFNYLKNKFYLQTK